MDQDPGATVHRGYPRAGEYDLIRKMGAGGFGTVFEARHRATGLPYAVKRIHLTPEDAERFRNEALYPARIASESLHVLGVVSFFHDDEADAFYLVTELIAHGDLRAFLDRQPKPLPLALGLDVGLGIAKGLAAIHAQQIVHRDLKPANVLMDRKDGRWIAKIADFGLARSISSVSIAQFATSGYAAPEQLDLLTDVPLGPESDLFSYGMVLYELLTGEKPTAAVGLKEYGRWLAARVPPPVPSRVRPELAAWPALDHLLARLLDFDRATRLASAVDVVRVLESVRHPAAAPGPGPSPSPPPPLPAPRPPVLPPPQVDPLARDKTAPMATHESSWKLRLALVPVFVATGSTMILATPWRYGLALPKPLQDLTVSATGYHPWFIAAAIGLPGLFGVAIALVARAGWRRLVACVGLTLAGYNAAFLAARLTHPIAELVSMIAGSVVGALAMLGVAAVARRQWPRWSRLTWMIVIGALLGVGGLWSIGSQRLELEIWTVAGGFAAWQVGVGVYVAAQPAGGLRRREWWILAAFTAGTLLLALIAGAT
jgi:serine/threonine protein kinase